jgi:hypothetical protein
MQNFHWRAKLAGFPTQWRETLLPRIHAPESFFAKAARDALPAMRRPLESSPEVSSPGFVE